jgi:outer membrane protein assembly factor BamB
MQSSHSSRYGSLALLVALTIPLMWVGSGLTEPPVKTKAKEATKKDEPRRDWPMLGGTPQRNLVNTVDKNMPIEWSIKEGQQKNIKWVAAVGKQSFGGPTISGGKIFVGTNNDSPRNPKVKDDHGVVMCFNEADGKFLWQALHEKLPSEENDWPKIGVISHPLIEGDRLYYVSNRCELICAKTSGKGEEADIVWRLDLVKDLEVFPRWLAGSSPLIVGDLVYVVTANGIDKDNKVVSPKAPSFIAVKKTTGEVAWKNNSPGAKIMDGQWANPAYAEVNGKGQVIFPGGDGWIYAFEPKTGDLIWKFDCNPKKSEYKPGGRGDRNFPVANPVVYDNKLYIGTGREPDDGPGVGHLWCIDITKTGDLSLVDDNFDPKAPVNKNSGLVWHYGGKVNPKPASGRDIVFGRTLSTCAIHDGLLYIAELEGFFHCLDAKTGQKYWDFDLGAGIWGSPLWVDGKIYQGTDDGEIQIFAHGKVAKQLAKIDMERPIKTTPVACNGVLYILTDSALYAIEKK